jgi:hypothetical protein
MSLITGLRGRDLPGIGNNAHLLHYCQSDLPSVRKVLSRRKMLLI